MYAPIEPEHGGMEDILRSLGAVLDTQMARAVRIRQHGDRLAVRALAVAGIAQRLDGAWSELERVITHVDRTQAQAAAAGRSRPGYVAGPHEHSLRVLGRVIDRRGLRDVTLIQHPSGVAWLLWHRVSARATLTLITLTNDELVAADAAVQSRYQPGPVPASDPQRLSGPRNRLSDPRPSRLTSGPREAIRVRPGLGTLAYAGAIAD